MDVEQWKTLVNFLRDSAKIFLGSLVVGAFISYPEKPISWAMFSFGMVLTVSFFLAALSAAKYSKEKS